MIACFPSCAREKVFLASFPFPHVTVLCLHPTAKHDYKFDIVFHSVFPPLLLRRRHFSIFNCAEHVAHFFFLTLFYTPRVCREP
jgi:hypothetical protein